ncbi:MAG: Ca-activated chloride channel [Bacteroidota bacterium]|nr:Ca-activated chloride channel [Bacteroidota bacterium]
MKDIFFANPSYFFLLLLVPVFIAWYIWKLKKLNPSLVVSTVEGFSKTKPSGRVRARHLLFILRALAFIFLVIALARPQSSSSRRSVQTEGIDIVMALDVSTSMLAEDFKPNRIEAAKKTALEFIENRPDDRIGLTIFSGESFTQCPVTIDHDVLKNLFKDIKSGMILDGTAIGMGLATAINRLKDSKAKSKVIILLTDGINNTGFIAPLTAADIAKTYGIRVYTIGVGTKGKAPYPFKVQTWSGQVITQYQNIDVQIDEEVLKKIASSTNGNYFRATGNKSLENIYKEIDKMEKTRIDVAHFTRFSEKFLPFVIIGLVLFGMELLLRYTILKFIP